MAGTLALGIGTQPGIAPGRKDANEATVYRAGVVDADLSGGIGIAVQNYGEAGPRILTGLALPRWLRGDDPATQRARTAQRDAAIVWTAYAHMRGRVDAGDGGQGTGPVPHDAGQATERLARGGELRGRATHYGEAYNGRPLGCGTGDYSSLDTTIVAVGGSNFWRFPCGSGVRVCGVGGCIDGIRQDACPGCDAAGVLVDLSEAGIDIVCGAEGSSSCTVTVQ